MISGGGLVKGVNRLGGHHYCCLQEDHVQAFIMFGTEGRVHDHCIKFVFPFVSKAGDVRIDDINIVDFEI